MFISNNRPRFTCGERKILIKKFHQNIVKLMLDLFESEELNSEVYFFCLQPEQPCLEKFCPKKTPKIANWSLHFIHRLLRI